MTYAPTLIRALASKHGIEGEPMLLPNGGMVYEAWLIGEDHVLRIIRAKGCDEEVPREAAVVPLVVAAGMQAPRLVAFDVAGDPRPYTIYERAAGELLGYVECDPMEFEPAYREIGRQIAMLGRIQVPEQSSGQFLKAKRGGPLKSLARAVSKGVIAPSDADAIVDWVERTRPLLGRCRRRVLLHQDIHPWNLFVDRATHTLTAIIDWGDAAFGDPAFEFASMPLVAVPAMLEGYQEAGGRPDPGFVPRILWNGISLAMWEIRELDPAEYDRRWWRLAPGGWPEMRDTMQRLFGM